jgi:hypothetical protein
MGITTKHVTNILYVSIQMVDEGKQPLISRFLLHFIISFEYLCIMLSHLSKWAISLLFVLGSRSYAQDLSLHLTGGVLNYQGDLRQEIYTFQGVKLGFGFGISYLITPRISAGLEFTQGRIAADDRYNSDPGLFYRNLNFTTNITEASLMGTIHLLDPQRSRLTPYVTGGIGLFRFNPFTHDVSGQKYFLQPLGTEGQGLSGSSMQPYRLTQLCIPFGGGLGFWINDNLQLAWEVVIRKTGTDYLDDVSTVYAKRNDLLLGRGPKAVELAFRGDQIPINPVFPFGYLDGAKRGNPGEKDWYYFSGLKIMLQLLSSDRMPGARSRKSRADCPRW